MDVDEKQLREKFAETQRNFSRLAYRQILRQVAGEIRGTGENGNRKSETGLILEMPLV